MSSEGGTAPSCKKPSLAGASQSDDEISVIAVIKKGTSGIPKRARYHYIRELPLASVKSFKKSLQKAKEAPKRRIPGVEGFPKTQSTRDSVRVMNDPKKPRVIELSDEISKMELRRQFKIAEKSVEEEDAFGAGLAASSASGDANIIHKLPPGTVLIKQEPRTPRQEVSQDNPSPSDPPEATEPGNNTNGSSAATATTSSSSSGSSSASSVSSSGSGSSSGGFGSGSASPSGKVKRVHRASKGAGRKTIVDVVPRRNPKRSGSKKGVTMAEVFTPTTTATASRPRQRQRLLSTRRQEGNGGATGAGTTNRRTKLATMPYMNTRSVTRKLYTVGATYQAPTRKDETEWREWPAHGMHERPVFHPQIGLAAGYAGRVFWSTTDAEGSNWTYREVLDAPEDVEIVPVDPGPNQTAPSTPSPSETKNSPKPTEESFEVCMHESLHSVLAYCAQLMAPGYREMVEKNRRRETEAEVKRSPQRDGDGIKETDAEVKPPHVNSTQLNLSQLEDSSISDETLMEMSSIYKKLLPIEDQPEDSPSASAQASPNSKDNFRRRRIGDGFSSGVKNPSEASEIARILSEYNESLKGRSFTSTVSDRGFLKGPGNGRDQEAPRKTLATGNTPVDVEGEGRAASTTDVPKASPEMEENRDRWLENLLVDTSLLYCVATGVGQRDLTNYVDGLDAKQSLQWLRRRDG